MRRGIWHQFGDRSQKCVIEQLDNGNGVGVIISPRDLSYDNAIMYSSEYRSRDADVLIDLQFHIPDFTNAKFESYNIVNFRRSVSGLGRLNDSNLSRLKSEIENINRSIRSSAVIAPAVVYEAGRPDIIDLNTRLFNISKDVGNVIGIPTYSTIFLGRSVTSDDQLLLSILSSATSLDCDGWYYSFEFDRERIPSSTQRLIRFSNASLNLACTGKPVMHAFAGPMGLISFGFGINSVGIGHSQNLWHFDRERWQTGSGQRGGADAPARFFSSALWGTIIYPDETRRLGRTLSNQVLTHSPFSANVRTNSAWSRWEAGKHLVYMIGSTASIIARDTDARICASNSIDILSRACQLHSSIRRLRVELGDNTSAYQSVWLNTVQNALASQADLYDYLALI